MADFITQFGLLFLLLVVISFIIKLLKQPIIVAYVITGIIFSAFFFKTQGLIEEQLTIFSMVGITFLLFLMGLEFDFKSLKFLGKDIIITTVIQSVIFFGIGFFVSHLFGFNFIEGVYISIAFMFSSTLLATKWLEDKKETRTLLGKLVLGTVILQDIFAIILMTVISVFGDFSITNLFLIPIKGIVLILIAIVLSKYILNHLLKIASKYPELLFILSLGVCFLFVEIAPLLGYSTTIGAFIAGVVLANTIYKIDISSRFKPLVIFFNMLFFLGLGFLLDFSGGYLTYIFIVILCFVLILVKPFFIYITFKWRGYDSKSSFLSSIYLTQGNEFGIIVVGSGLILGLITGEIANIIIIFVLLSFIVSSYFIKYSNKIYYKFEKYIKIFDKYISKKDKEIIEEKFDYTIIFFGYHDLSKDILEKMKNLGKKIVIIENDPEKIEIIKQEGFNYIYNSIADNEFFENIPFDKIELVVSSIIDVEENKRIIKVLKSKNKTAVAIVSAKSLKDSIELYEYDADYVIFTAYLNNQQVSVLLEDYTNDLNKVIEKKIKESTKLKEIQQKRLNARKNIDLSLNDFKIPYKNHINEFKKKVDLLIKNTIKNNKQQQK
jgi:Kef-type K+ transport system membrane component KefB/Trk K+ transport system NAD-binding subunit